MKGKMAMLLLSVLIVLVFSVQTDLRAEISDALHEIASLRSQ